MFRNKITSLYDKHHSAMIHLSVLFGWITGKNQGNRDIRKILKHYYKVLLTVKAVRKLS